MADGENGQVEAPSSDPKTNHVEPEISKKGASPGLLLLRQTLSSVSALVGTVTIGATFGYSAILLPQLKTQPQNTSLGISLLATHAADVENRIRVNSIEEESWIAASAIILMAPGCWLSGVLMETLGRKKTQLLISPIYIAAWLTIGFAPDFWVLITGRILSGLCVGLLSPLSPVYIAETSEPRLRGLLLSGISLALAIGILISHVMGTWLSWRVAAHLSSILPALCLLPSLLSPESPAWLVKMNRIPEAEKAWKYLRGDNASTEFEALKCGGRPNSETETRTGGLQDSLWKSPAFLKPLIILNVFFFTAQFSGFNSVIFYCVQVIAEVSGPSGGEIAPYVTLVLDAVRVLASVIVCWLTRRYPRRVLALSSGALTAASLFTLGLSLVFEFGESWLPASLMVVYICATGIGLVPLPWMLCGELFPAALRGLGSGLSSGICFIFFFIVVKTGPAMFNSLGNTGTFFFYGAVTTVGTLFIYRFLPETKDITLKEIEESFSRKSKVVDENKKRTNVTV